MNRIEEQYKRIKAEETESKSLAQPLTIGAILQLIDDDALVIPEFQRNFEWDLNRFVLLFDSIYRGYTIGNLLFWKTNHKLAHKHIGSEKSVPLNPIDDKFHTTYVLDGQQRLTTLYGILRGKAISRNGNKPKLYKIYFDIVNNEFIKETQKIEDLGNRTIKKINRTIKKIISDGDYDEFRFIDLSQIYDTKLNFPDNLIKAQENANKTELKQKIISQEEYFKRDDDLKNKEDYLNHFADIIKAYKIPQIVDYSNDIDKVVTVFERINTQNMQLDIFDIMVAKTYENVVFNGDKYTFNLNRAADKILYNRDLADEKLKPNIELPDDDNLYYGIYDVTLLRLISIHCNAQDKIALQKKRYLRTESTRDSK